MKILFTHSYFYRLDSKQWNTHQPYPPLGTMYAAAMMREQGHEVAIFDVGLCQAPEEIMAVLEKEDLDLLVIYDDGFNYLTKMCLTTMREAAFVMAQYAQEFGAKVMVCSSDSTDHYEKYLQNGVDFVLLGEGEITLKELVEELEKTDGDVYSVQGIVTLQAGEIVKTAKRKVLKELDTLPMAAWDLVDIAPYRHIWLQHHGYFCLNIATTRGCPYKCNWCAKPIYGNRYNTRSPKKVAEEIAFLTEKYAADYFWMCDDIFGLKPNWVQEFRAEVQTRKLKFRYKIQSRADLLLEADNIQALADTGLDMVWMGAESGSQEILDAMDKGTTIAQIEDATKLLKSKGVKVAFFLQFGYLGETATDIDKTINLVERLLPDDIGISVSYPLPNTSFYDKVKADLKGKANWTDSDDLAMMFKNTYPPAYYKKLHRFVHKKYRIAQGFSFLQNLSSSTISYDKLRRIAAIAYYFPTLLWDSYQLEKLKRWE
ncbi:MAG: B12-binding domain-containing radical SAM protein [Bacteroidia bacterium]